MLIKVLADNIAASEKFEAEHGLSLYIETKKKRLLFDLGAGPLFSRNARKMGVDVAGVDLAVISHGHYDHGGGLETFLGLNSSAKIYVHEKAFDDRFSLRQGSPKYSGLDKDLLSTAGDRFIFTGDHFVIDEQLELFSNIEGHKFSPAGNKNLYMKRGSQLVRDDFKHEQNLIIKENGTVVLIAGCAHRGIVNIVNSLRSFQYGPLAAVVGGFHLYSASAGRSEDAAVVAQIAQFLVESGARYYTGHCTGEEAYEQLKKIMGDKIDYASAGREFRL